jgi:hypothetical protein
MALTDRVKNILLSPKTEWQVINGETETPQSLLTKYVIPLLLIPAIASFIGYGFVGIDAFIVKIKGVRWGAYFAVQQFVAGIIGYYVATYVIDALASSFSSEKNIGKSAQLVAYASTAFWVAGIFNLIPSLGILGLLGLYGIYLFYVGLPILKKTPEDKRIVYMIVAALVIIVVNWLVLWIVGKVLNAVMGNPYGLTATETLQDLLK